MSTRMAIQRKAKVSKSRVHAQDSIAPDADVAQMVTQDVNQLSSQNLLQLQRTLGNQAVLKLAGNHMAPRPSLFRSPVIQRLPTSVTIEEAMALDIETKKKAEETSTSTATTSSSTPPSSDLMSTEPTTTETTSSTPVPDTKPKSDTEPAEKSPSLGEQALSFLGKIGKSIADFIDQATYHAVLKALDEFHTYDEAFKKLTPAYTDHIKRLKLIKNIQDMSDLFLGMHKAGDPGFKSITALRVEAVDTYTKASPNADRALKTKEELLAKQSADKSSPTRITDDLIEIMVLSVASPMSETSDMGASGILGIQSATDAADALTLVREEDYTKIMTMLKSSGDAFGDTAKHATLIKAVAARKVDLVAAGPQTEAALKELEDFRAKITGMDRADMIDQTHVADRGSGVGMQQRFTMSCGPTSIQITRGEFDPIYALKVNDEGRKSLTYDNNIAQGQQSLLEGENGVDTAVPREVEDDWKKAVNQLNVYISTAIPENKVKIQHFIKSIAGLAHDATKAAEGLVLVKANVVDVDIDKRVPEWTKYYAHLGNAPGLDNSQFAKLAKAEIGTATGRDFNETAVAYKEEIVAGKKELKGEIEKHFVPLDEALFKGKSVPLGVMWADGGGHFMVFTDMKEKDESGTKVKYYLVSDPWEGHSGWMSRQDLIDGKFGLIGASQGAIDSIYL